MDFFYSSIQSLRKGNIYFIIPSFISLLWNKIRSICSGVCQSHSKTLLLWKLKITKGIIISLLFIFSRDYNYPWKELLYKLKNRLLLNMFYMIDFNYFIPFPYCRRKQNFLQMEFFFTLPHHNLTVTLYYNIKYSSAKNL